MHLHRLSRRTRSAPDGLQALDQSEKATFAERDGIHARLLEEIERIGRRAIAEGRAEAYRP